ncbi:MAG: hypothetical protein EX330_00365 [Candidatus Brocadia sp. BROELEC01]|nr:hypothetical protein [Candidatus Brocadia sapporoensis]QQR65836.1 MAG: hypothetical protein IPI25_09725 [Candidatus Brocadia sp.]RZV59665.1 MAG: hypothetical protein EX330_00365 [Candidatus Brocadia sp. BROELEC01]
MTYDEDSLSFPAILICAPHPNLGGDMDNNITTSIARVSADRGFTSLRFNYRGVGNSECHIKDIAQRFQYWDVSLNGGDYTDAVTDTHSALNFLISQIGKEHGIFVAGYSFGAFVGMRVGAESKYIKAFAGISIPFGRYPLNFLPECKKSKLCIYSQNDFSTTVKDTLKGFESLLPPKTLELMENSDHFYRGQEDLISQKICTFFTDQGKESTR